MSEVFERGGVGQTIEKTTESQDIQAVLIKHRGQCPKEKGHGFEGLLHAAAGGAMVALVVAGFISQFYPNREKEAIQRGYATRDPITYEFQWRGAQ